MLENPFWSASIAEAGRGGAIQQGVFQQLCAETGSVIHSADFPLCPCPSFLLCLGFVLCFYFFLSKCPQFEHLKSKQATFMPLTCAFSVSVCCTRMYVYVCVCAVCVRVCVRLTAIWSLSLKFCNMPSTSHGYFYDYHTLWSQGAGVTPQPKKTRPSGCSLLLFSDSFSLSPSLTTLPCVPFRVSLTISAVCPLTADDRERERLER